MSSAVAVPEPDPVLVSPVRHDAQSLLSSRPPEAKPAIERPRVDQEGRGVRWECHDGTHICTHWPDDGVTQIQTAAHWLRGVATGLTHEALFAPPAARYTGCVDLDSLLGKPTGDNPPQRLAALLAQVQAQKLALSSLADAFAAVSRWLTATGDSNWEAAKAIRRLPGLSAAIGESQRVISKDSFSADANALIATMLHRAVKLLDRLTLETGEINVDTAQQHGLQLLIPTIALLDSTAQLAAEAARFVEEFDQRWRQMRQQAAHAVASTASLAAFPQSRL